MSAYIHEASGVDPVEPESTPEDSVTPEVTSEGEVFESSLNEGGESGNGGEPSQEQIVEDIQESLISKLTQSANDGTLETILKDVFPNTSDEQREDLLNYIDQSIQSGDWFWLPPPQLVSNEELDGNFGAYSADGDLIFINEEASLEDQQETYWEEIGHFFDDTYLSSGVDAEGNVIDTEGDEGELFRLALDGTLYADGEFNEALASNTIDETDTIEIENDDGTTTEYEVEFNSDTESSETAPATEFEDTILSHYAGYFPEEDFPDGFQSNLAVDFLNLVRSTHKDHYTTSGAGFDTFDHLFRDAQWSSEDIATVRSLYNQYATDEVEYYGDSYPIIESHTQAFADFMQELESLVEQMPQYQQEGPTIAFMEPFGTQPDVAKIAIIQTDSTTVRIEINNDQTQRAVITQAGDSEDTYIEEHRDTLGYIQTGTRVENGKTVEQISRDQLGGLVTEFFDPADSSLLRTETITAEGLLEVTEPVSSASTEGFPASLSGTSVRTTYANDTDDASLRGTVMSQALLDDDGNVLAVRSNLGNGQYQLTEYDVATGDITSQSGVNGGEYVSAFSAPTAPPRYEGPRDIPNSIHLTNLPPEEGQTFLDRTGSVVQTQFQQGNVTTAITYNEEYLPSQITSEQTDGNGNVVRREVTTINEETNEATSEIFVRNSAGELVPDRLTVHGAGFTEYHSYEADGTLSPNVIRENNDGLTEYLTFDAPGGNLVSRAMYRQGELQGVVSYENDSIGTATLYKDGVAQEPESVLQILLDSQTIPTWGSEDAFFDTDLLRPEHRGYEFEVDEDGNLKEDEDGNFVIVAVDDGNSNPNDSKVEVDSRVANLLGHSIGAAGIDLTSRIADGKISIQKAADALNLQRFAYHPANVHITEATPTIGPDGELLDEGFEIEQRYHDYESQRAVDLSDRLDDSFFNPDASDGDSVTINRYDPSDHLNDPDAGFTGTRLPSSSADEAFELTLDATGTFKYKNADEALQTAAGFINKLFDRNLPKVTGWYGGGIPNLITGQILGNTQDLFSVASGLLQKHSPVRGSNGAGIAADLARFDSGFFAKAGLEGTDAATDFAKKVFLKAVGEVGEKAALKAAQVAKAAVSAAPLLILDFVVNLVIAGTLFKDAAENKDPLKYIEATLALFGLDFLVTIFRPKAPPPPIQVDNIDELSSRGDLYYQLTNTENYGAQYAEDQAEAYINALEDHLIRDHLPPGHDPNAVQIEYYRGLGDDGVTFIYPALVNVEDFFGPDDLIPDGLSFIPVDEHRPDFEDPSVLRHDSTDWKEVLTVYYKSTRGDYDPPTQGNLTVVGAPGAQPERYSGPDISHLVDGTNGYEQYQTEDNGYWEGDTWNWYPPFDENPPQVVWDWNAQRPESEEAEYGEPYHGAKGWFVVLNAGQYAAGNRPEFNIPREVREIGLATTDPNGAQFNQRNTDVFITENGERPDDPTYGQIWDRQLNQFLSSKREEAQTDLLEKYNIAETAASGVTPQFTYIINDDGNSEMVISNLDKLYPEGYPRETPEIYENSLPTWAYFTEIEDVEEREQYERDLLLASFLTEDVTNYLASYDVANSHDGFLLWSDIEKMLEPFLSGVDEATRNVSKRAIEELFEQFAADSAIIGGRPFPPRIYAEGYENFLNALLEHRQEFENDFTGSANDEQPLDVQPPPVPAPTPAPAPYSDPKHTEFHGSGGGVPGY